MVLQFYSVILVLVKPEKTKHLKVGGSVWDAPGRGSNGTAPWLPAEPTASIPVPSVPAPVRPLCVHMCAVCVYMPACV